MSDGLYNGVSGLALGTGLYKGVSGLWSGASGLEAGFGNAATLFLNFLSGTLDSRVTFTRSSTATFVGSDGFIQTAAINVPRFDYDPNRLEPRGLLIEEQRTNLTLHSGVTSANWAAIGGTLANAGKTAPDGTSLMGLFTEDTALSPHQMFVTTPPTAIALNTTYTASIYLAAGTRRYVVVYAGTSANGWGVTVDTATWTITGDAQTGTCSIISSSVVTAGNGIYRVTLTGVQSSGVGAMAYVAIGGAPTEDGAVVDNIYLGDGSDFFAWGAQFEEGAFASSYVPTVASQVTRGADIAVMTGSNFSSWFNAAEGTFAFSGDSAYSSGGFIGSVPTTGALLYATANAARTFNGTNFIETANTYRDNAVFTTALGYSTSGRAIVLDSGTVATDANLIQTPAAVTLGGAFGGGYLNGHIRQIVYYNTRLPDATLQTLAT